MKVHCWRAVIGIMGRIAVPRVVMRITITGIRIRISAVAGSRIQDGAILLAGSVGPVRHKSGKTQNGGCRVVSRIVESYPYQKVL